MTIFYSQSLSAAMVVVLLLIGLLMTAVGATTTSPTLSEAERGGDGGDLDKPNLLVVILGSVPASTIYTAAGHAMSQSSASFYAANLRFLEKESLVFDNAYVNIARSSPSRASLLTSLHPRRQLGLMGDANLATSSAFAQSRTTVFSTYLKNQLSLQAVGTGRIFKTFQSTVAYGGFSSFAIPRRGDQDSFCGDAQSCLVTDENTLTDADVADRTVEFLRGFVRAQQRFTLVVGLARPYEQKSFPTWADVQVNKRRFNLLAQQQPNSAIPPTNPLFTVNSRTPLTPTQINNMKVATYGAIQWADFCMGRIIDELRGLRLWSNTIVVVTSDTAQSTGEFSDTSADGSAVYEHTTRVPLYIRDPRAPKTFGRRTGARVELVDIGTTIYDLMDVPRPASGSGTSKLKLEGTSLRGLLQIYQNNPRPSFTSNIFYNISTRHAAISESARCTRSSSPFYGLAPGVVVPTESIWTDCAEYPGRIDVLAISMRNSRWRYTEYRTAVNNQPIWETEGLVGRELFSHSADDGLENTADGNRFELMNLAPCPEFVCRLVVPPSSKPPVANPSVGLPNDPRPNEFYTAPSLPGNAAMARLVRTFALMIRSTGRDGVSMCTGHGLVNPDTGACAECDEGWTGPLCSQGVFPELIPGEDVSITSSPTFPPSPTARAPVGAPTPPPSLSKAPTRKTTPAPIGPLQCEDRLTMGSCLSSPSCGWFNNQCREITSAPVPTEPSGGLKGTCETIKAESVCRSINGCAYLGRTLGCVTPFPTACNCEVAMEVTSAFVPADRVSGASGFVQLFRNPCHATCRGAILPTPAPTDRPTFATRSPNTPPPTYPKGLPFPSRPGEANAQPVTSMTLYLVLDASVNIANSDDICRTSKGFPCIHVASVFFDLVQQKLSEYVLQGITSFRVGVWAYSCQDSNPLYVDIQVPISADKLGNVLRKVRDNIAPRGGRCPSKVFEIILGHDRSESRLTPNRAMVYLQSGPLNSEDLELAKQRAKELRIQGVATFAVVVARANPFQQPAKAREDALEIVGRTERVLIASQRQGVLALNGVIIPLSAAILAILNEPTRIDESSLDEGQVSPSFWTDDGFSDPSLDETSATSVAMGVIAAIVVVGIVGFVAYKRRRHALQTNAAADAGSENGINGVVVVSAAASEADGGDTRVFEVARASPVKTARRRSLEQQKDLYTASKALSFNIVESTNDV